MKCCYHYFSSYFTLIIIELLIICSSSVLFVKLCLGAQPNNNNKNEPRLCHFPPKWTIEGNRDIMKEHVGNVTLVALMELQCTFCKNQINSLERLLEYIKQHLTDPTRIIIIAPFNESTSFVQYYQTTLSKKGFTIVQETEENPIWPLLGGCNNDFFLYDMCGRLNFHIPYPQSFTYYHYTINTLYSVHRHQKCGPCEHDMPENRPHLYTDPSILTPKQVKAWVNSMPPGHRTADQLGYRYPPQVTHASTTTAQPIDDYRSRHGSHYRPDTGRYYWAPATTTTTTTLAPTHYRIAAKERQRPHRPDYRDKNGHKIRHPHQNRRGKWRSTTTLAPTTTTVDELDEEYDVEYDFEDDATQHVDQNRKTTRKPSINLSAQMATAQIPKPKTATEPTAPKFESSTSSAIRSGGGSVEVNTDEEEGDVEDLGDADELAEQRHAVEESKTKPVISELDALRYQANSMAAQKYQPSNGVLSKGQKMTNQSQSLADDKKPRIRGGGRKNKTRGKLGQGGISLGGMMGNNVNNNSDYSRIVVNGSSSACTAFSDFFCLTSQNENKPLHPCCYKGVYLTPVCTPNKCSTKTYSLCCFQKFQQARFRCCYNESIQHRSPDDFSKCCYDTLVLEDDPCCPNQIAASYWTFKSRISEMCLPTIDLIFDDVVLEGETRDKLKIQINLGQYKSLKYSCPASKKRDDFFYYEPPERENNNGNGNRTTKSNINNNGVDSSRSRRR